MTGRVDAAVEVAHRLGLRVGRPVVLREVTSALVHLAPSRVVARVWATGRRDEVAVRRELELTAYLAARGAAIAPPYDEPGPFRAGDQVVTLWHLVDHDADRPLDARAAGRALREIHDLLVDADAPDLDDLPHFARFEEAAETVAGLALTPADREGLEEMLALAAPRLATTDLPLRPLHGDAWLGNVLRTPRGPVWTDFELACRGPREVDLAANRAVSRLRGGSPADDELLAGYGGHHDDLVASLMPLTLIPFAALGFRVAVEHEQYLPAARARLALALEGLGATG